ncbi:MULTISPECIES: helix-turn-helix domain-containing protein [Streptomyces]|uniref:Helix-turn-helix transcriptional regulator n=1 Tax=Streptomyces thermoviolaceus subsp. thermoviolaceus TaxID=66860 RepID=A0ABX0YXZ8_STRTL|nr:helix-turn-helix transcriptional regulator [Streptomyces thermoviolaceus]MCM3262856.1 helix-turn-helix transcriptional regulator [Streptomyces thermoviolaceus]NJP15946.1 helix-turn-helix transcriptional regulator [Streptomyces thermoviolaceus subsp. thermoviolaceus]GGV79901.1 transcriptional regulator [Streptomyces thermoviolaceus subsp. apingens]GHA96948.1 transcriptional regulator [Streptomyces thermoviolaceus subsp. thermoviolaceus]
MPPRATPTERQKRLGAELRKMRLAAQVSTEYAAGLLGLDRTKISNIESGVRAITPDRVRTLACNYDCRDQAYVDALAEMAGDRKRGWWETYRGQLPAGLLDIAELEWHARKVRAGLAMHVPGLLQTDAYARVLFSMALPALSPMEVELRVALRMQRQQVLHRENPITYVGYVHEAALRIEFGGPKVMRTQLDHLCDISERENIDVRVIPFKAGAFPGAGQAVMYAEARVPQLDTVELDSAHGPEFLHGQSQLDKYRSHLDWMESASLSPCESRAFMHDIAADF